MSFSVDVVKQLKDLRNRSIHPDANHGHVNPQNIFDVRDVDAKLPILNRLVCLLLAHPTNTPPANPGSMSSSNDFAGLLSVAIVLPR